MFFEPHGQYLEGKESRGPGESRRLFCSAFNRFRDFLKSKGMISKDVDQLPAESVYSWARCGLFHSTRLANELLVDAVGFGRACLAENSMLGGWLIDPWLMLDLLERYLDSYVSEVKNAPDDYQIVKNFEATFNRLLLEPMTHFCMQSRGKEP